MNEEHGYLSDDELEALIAEAETGEMLHAPVYLKEQIIKSIPVEQKASTNRLLLFYSVKIVAAAAAAVFVLTIMPMGLGRGAVLPDSYVREQQIEQQVVRDMERYKNRNEEVISDENENKYKVTSLINKKTSELCQKLNSFSNWLIMEDKEYD